MDVIYRILNASEADGVGYISGRPYDKEVAEALVKDQLRGDPAIGTGEDNHVRLLPGGEFVPK
jgi:hypothetical protein